MTCFLNNKLCFAGLAAMCPCLFHAGTGATAVYQ